MDEYINRKTALENIRKIYELGGFPTGRDAFEVINNVLATMSAADVVEVVHAEWEEIDGGYRCTNCHHAPIVGIDNEFRLTNFCPNCGADMRGNLNA